MTRSHARNKNGRSKPTRGKRKGKRRLSSEHSHIKRIMEGFSRRRNRQVLASRGRKSNLPSGALHRPGGRKRHTRPMQAQKRRRQSASRHRYPRKSMRY